MDISHRAASIADLPFAVRCRDGRFSALMNEYRVYLGLWLLLAALPTCAAEAGIATIVDGPARVLRGTVWYKLAPGAPFQEGDVIDAAERAQVQIELASGATMHLVGPAGLYAASIPARGDKDGPAEIGLDRGWLKLVSSGGGTRIRTQTASITVGDAIVVARQDGKQLELFVESGSAKIAESTRTGRDGAVHEAAAGQYWSRDGDKPFVTERRAPPKFVSSMPRQMMDRLANLGARFKDKRTQLSGDREITLAEAEPWLTGPYRRAFARRLSPRLTDPAFRQGVEANAAAYPEFDRILHPEKYTTQTGAATPASPQTPSAPANAPPSTPQPAQTAPQKPWWLRGASTSLVIASLETRINRSSP